uniref:Uncharacterized protein n=1 Tax=Pipistrellus kuhlii TaxID=59472 RepID=A0A7J7SV15_PIPKU|nr:hypothetical protein mPipKuh1_009762 [Pipistrellus kuhlii]
MNASIFLALFYLGIASAAPEMDHSLHAQSNLFEATDEEVSDMVKDLMDVINDVLVEESPKVLDTHSQEQSEEQQSNRTASNHSDGLSLLIKPLKEMLHKVEDLMDAVSGVLVEESPKVLDTHSQEQSEEQQSNRTASNHSDDLSLLIKPLKEMLHKSKGTARKGMLGKIAKVLGKELVNKIVKNASKVIKVGKHIGELILGDAETSKSSGVVFNVSRARALGDNSPRLTLEDSEDGDEVSAARNA